jgi:4-hydroxybenzoate polyprenyltransferase
MRFHVALVPVLVTWFFQEPLGYRVDARYYAVVALNTLVGYWANILSDTREDRVNGRPSEAFAEHCRLFAAAVALCSLVSFLLALQAGWRFVLFGFALNALGALYGLRVRLHSSSEQIRVKSATGIKNIYAALFWSAALLLGPFVYNGQTPQSGFALITASVFCAACYVELLWDVRDVPGDAAAGVRTIPVRYGLARTRLMLHLLNIGAAAAMAGAALVDPGAPWSTSLALAALTALFTERYCRAPDKEMLSHLYLGLVALVLVASKGLPTS